MDQAQTPRNSARPLPQRNTRLRVESDRTVDLRARLLMGDAEAAQVARGTFRLLYWEHGGRKILPLPDDQKNSRRRDNP